MIKRKNSEEKSDKTRPVVTTETWPFEMVEGERFHEQSTSEEFILQQKVYPSA